MPIDTAAAGHDDSRLATAATPNWLDADMVERILDIDDGALAILRRSGGVLSVWAPRQRAYRYPDFQFGAGRVLAEIPELLFLRGPRTLTGMRELEWFYLPHALLDGASPAALLQVDAARVLKVAQREHAHSLCPQCGLLTTPERAAEDRFAATLQ